MRERSKFGWAERFILFDYLAIDWLLLLIGEGWNEVVKRSVSTQFSSHLTILNYYKLVSTYCLNHYKNASPQSSPSRRGRAKYGWAERFILFDYLAIDWLLLL
jgi:hypothetical protein